MITELQIDSTIVKAHRHAAGAPKKMGPQSLGKSRGGWIAKIHVSICGVSGQIGRLILTRGQAADCMLGPKLVEGVRHRAILTDRAYDTEQMISVDKALGAEVVTPLYATAGTTDRSTIMFAGAGI